MNIHVNRLILLGTLLAIALSLWAASEDTAQVSFDRTMTVAGTPIQPGRYEFRVKPNDTTVQVRQSSDNRLIARVPGKWVAVNSKPQQTEVLINEDKDSIQEIDFQDKMEAIRFTEDSAK